MKTYITRALARITLLSTLILPMGALWAATTEISNVPLVGASTGGAPPNIMVLLDTSNSMSWTHMPDQMEVPGARQSIGYKSNECNALYYNRDTKYTIPKDSAGAALPTPDIGSAYYNYYVDKTTKVDLTKNFKAHDANTVQNIVTSVEDTAQPAYYFYFKPSGSTAPTFSYNSKPCNDTDPGSYPTSTWIPTPVTGISKGPNTTGGNWMRVVVGSGTGSATPVGVDERLNFATWYTYYRTRINLSKSAIGQAFQNLSNTYRVGLITVNPTLDATNTATSSVQSSHYTSIQDFDSAQRTLWYNNFYSQLPAGSSPAREALARVGRHYAGKTDGINTGMNSDPVSHACQRNYTIMTTDGYWNVAAEKSGFSGGPTTMDGTAWVGQQDGLPGYPFTADTDPAGLVPAGVFDGTLLQLGYTINATDTTRYTYPLCDLTVPGYYTQTTFRNTAPMIKTVVPSKYQYRYVSYSRTSFKTTKEVGQYTKPMVTKRVTQYQWYDAASEKTLFVTSCANKTNCTTLQDTSTAVDASQCTSGQTANLVTTTCSSPAVDTPQSAPCTALQGCTYKVTTPAAFSTLNGCNAGISAAPNYLVTTCTRNAPTTSTPSTTATSALVESSVYPCSASDNSASTGTIQCSNLNALTNYVDTTAGTTATTCSAAGTTAVDGTKAKQCQLVQVCDPTLASCTSAVVTTGTSCSGSTNATSITTCTTQATSPITASVAVDRTTCNSQSPNATNGWSYITCTRSPTNPTTVAGVCNPTNGAAPDWVATICNPVTLTNGGWREDSQKTTSAVWTYTNGTTVNPPDVKAAVISGVCKAPPKPDQKADLVVPLAPSTVAAVSGGSTNSLADVAQYYYVNDLRPDLPNLVPPNGSGPRDDKATWQHMTTFVVGLGVSGTLQYPGQDYASAGTGTFADIRSFNKSWPVWPDPAINYTNNDTAWNAPQSIDDFWHTAVNGRGTYFSATNPISVQAGIQSALRSAGASTGSSTALTISDQVNVTNTGLNFASSYTLNDWVGDVQAFDSSSKSVLWKAQEKISAQTDVACDNRNIYVRDTSTSNKLGAFTVSTKNCTTSATTTALSATLQGLISASGLTQYANMSATQKTSATVASLVNYLRGQSQYEGFVGGGLSTQLYRARKGKLGDIVNSKPQFVGAPYFDYVDEGYYTFKTDNASRQNMIYVGGNDGMLHAIYAPPSTASATQLAKQGQEAWAFIPTQVISSLSKLADNDYASNHRFYVDGTPTVGDVKFADGSWHTILVGGLRAGGKGYYALDITDPATPRSLWEFDSSNCTRSGCSVGLTFGQPVIGKMADGTWAVFMTSGFNNSTGQAALFVVNAETGASIKTINAGAASTGTPLGLSAISAWSDLPSLDRTVTRVYGGDLYGNVWRFDVNSSTTDAVSLIGIAKDKTGAVQPITMPPELGKVGGKPFVYIGTGRLVGSSDFADTQQQTVYAIADDLSTNTTATPTLDLRALTAYVTTSDLKIACAVTSCTPLSSKGFLIDMLGSAEKVITPLAIVGNTLVIISTQPQDNTCGSGGSSKVYFADATNGTTVDKGLDLLNTVVGVIYLNSANQTVIGDVRFGSGTGSTTNTEGETVALPPDVYSGGGSQSFTVPTNNQPPGVTRASWREIIKR